MRVFILLIGIPFVASAITFALKAQQPKAPENKYSVTLPLSSWVQITQQLEFIKSQLRQSDIPSKQVAYMSDSLLTPMQAMIGSQVNAQLEFEKPKSEIKKDSTTKPKK